jgi:ribosomal protein L29
MDKKELREQNLKQLKETLEKKISEFEKNYLEMRTGQEQDLHAPRKLRKEIAVVKTIIKEKELNKLNNGKDE